MILYGVYTAGPPHFIVSGSVLIAPLVIDGMVEREMLRQINLLIAPNAHRPSCSHSLFFVSLVLLVWDLFSLEKMQVKFGADACQVYVFL
jgi:hypothetical protein